MLKLYNTLTRKIESFKPLNPKKIKLFVCGVTTYDYAHIGHAKSYIQFDVIVRYLRYRGYNVFYLQNVTDIDDKIIDRAKQEKRDPMELSRFFEKTYLEDMKALNVISVSKLARATDYMKEIIDQVKRMLDQGIAYELNDGIYFDIQKFKEYGKLSHQPLDKLTKHRVDANLSKRNPGDFVLWKKHKPGEPFWQSPWGKGRPGWHIEDTAITETLLGQQYDIHGGGIDLIFPHHEAEIAQMESLSHKPLVKYWLHNGFLMINNEKMSKSLGNFVTIRDAIGKWGAMAVRFLFATSHYRSQINFTEDSVKAAQAGVETIRNAFISLDVKIKEAKAGKIDDKFLQKAEKYKSQFIREMDDDFNAAKASAVVFDYIHALHAYEGNKQTLKRCVSILKELVEILGIVVDEKETIPKQVKDLVKQRELARKDKNWGKADLIRAEIGKMGYSVDDTGSGPVIKKIK
jgi:cysteinyl-tRNA synthetase